MPHSVQKPALAPRLIRWYRRCARPLPWRATCDPYRIWISEIMLQQTRVETVIPYYLHFVRKFPNLTALSRAGVNSVLKAWEGLGYYARARNLHRAARLLAGGRAPRLPKSAADWELLPGVGKYSAAAVASIVFDEPAVALDANVRRILARANAYRRAIRGPIADRDLAMRFRDARGRAKPGEFLQAMMELGQIICLPRQPHCTECPIALQCKSFQGGIQNSMPAPQRRSRIPHFNVTAGVIERRGRVLIARRPAGTILAGMWEFPGGKRERGETLPASLRRELREELGIGIRTQEKIYSLDHAFTHMRITLHVYRCILARGNPHPIGVDAVRWVKTKDLAKYPMGKADRRVVDFLFPIGRVKKNING